MSSTQSQNPNSAISALLFGNFVVGVSVLLVPGMLSTLAAGLTVSVPAAGQLITVASIVMGVGAPLAAALTWRVDRRLLLTGSLLLFVLGHLACAFTQSFSQLLIARAVTVIAAAIFTPQAAATIGLMVEPKQRPAALASIFIGWSIASVVAMPLVNLIAISLSWRAPFFIASAVSILGALWVYIVIPKGLRVAPLALAAWLKVARHPILIPVLGVTLISFAGQFMIFSYMVPLLERSLSLSPSGIALTVFLYGVTGVIGNALSAKFMPRIGAEKLMLICLIAMIAAMGLIGLGIGSATNYLFVGQLITTLGFVIWGAAGFSGNSTQQGRLFVAAPELASASIALNSSCLYLGQAIGTALAGLLIASQGDYLSLPWFTSGFLIFALFVSMIASKAVAKSVRA
jgi:predicted MFS family arabinose efflux permease